jgi:hypothetical protein
VTPLWRAILEVQLRHFSATGARPAQARAEIASDSARGEGDHATAMQTVGGAYGGMGIRKQEAREDETG